MEQIYNYNPVTFAPRRVLRLDIAMKNNLSSRLSRAKLDFLFFRSRNDAVMSGHIVHHGTRNMCESVTLCVYSHKDPWGVHVVKRGR